MNKEKDVFLKYFGYLFFLFLGLGSCKEKIIVIPENILSQDSLAYIMMDMQLLEAMKIKSGINDSISSDSILNQYALIFKKHKTDQELFELSLDFYKKNPELLEEIYDKVINELSRKQAMLGNLNTAFTDSIKKSRDTGPPHKLAREVMILHEEKLKMEAKKKTESKKKLLQTDTVKIPAKSKKK